MANKNFTELPAVASATLSDIMAAVQGGVTVQVLQSQVYSLFRDEMITSNAGNPNGAIGGNIFEFCYDTANKDLYICTTSGVAGIAVWTLIGANIVDPVQGGTGVSNPTIHTLPVAQGSSAYNFLGPLTNGQLLVGSTGADPVAASITPGTNISVTNGAGSITVAATGHGSFTWNEVITTSDNMSANNGYIANNGSLVTLTLPTTAAVGDRIGVVGQGAGGWKIAQNASQLIHVGSSVTTTGAGGSVASTNAFDSIDLVCTVTDTTWSCFGGVQGILTIV